MCFIYLIYMFYILCVSYVHVYMFICMAVYFLPHRKMAKIAFYWICHAVTVICYPFSSLVPSVLVGYFYVRDSDSTNSFRHSVKLIFTFSLFFMFAFISSIHCFFISSSSFLLMDCTRQVRWTPDIN